ncbi:peroxidasin isoform X5 [Zootermopsis nevadensis]|uniref:peroxidasin isoform X5 n=1 Tax=Zootermopsis nevadensis TaxID=136037 RepID=UPI000B8E598F|nr:peroxidasin isoform X5 [Zootermopsis nevadensis]
MLAFVILLAAFCTGLAEAQCPARCLCFRTTVRCMFLQLDKVPEVPPETTILDLRFNKIREIPANAFKNLKHLNTLLLNNNHIIRLQNGVFNGLKDLRYLYLHFNELVDIEPDTFSNLPSLERLYLHFNRIENLGPGVFSELRNLERLFLHNNKLQRIPVGAFKNLEALKRLRLDSNALICDCEMMWLVQMLQEKLRGTQAAATCQYPVVMQGKSLTAMTETDFHCKKPKITEDPHDVEVTFGGTVFFTCKAEGDPVPDIVWMRDSNEINMGDPRYSKLADGTLMIENTLDSDMGVYECMAKSPAGEAKSRAAKMHYQKTKEKPQFRRTPLDQEVEQGSTVRLYCAALGQPHPDITWSHDDIPIVSGDRFEISSDNTLTITDVQREDAGHYKCSAANFVGRITSVANVKVNESLSKVVPSFTTHPENLTLKSGGLAELQCAADGTPAPTITWFKDGHRIVPGGRNSFSSTGQQLYIQHAKESDSGLYTCRAQNSVGFKETSAHLVVSGVHRDTSTQYFAQRDGPVPRLVITPYNMDAPSGSTIEIPCKAEGDPKPTITWTKDGATLLLTKRHRISSVGSLYISNISQEDAGTYECSVVNSNGRTRAHGNLRVKEESMMGPGDRFVHIAFQEASKAVDRAVNDTLTKLFTRDRGAKNSSPNELFRLLRFPNAAARNVARAADIYERTLINVRKHVEAGMNINLTTDFSYKDLLSPSHLELVANLSGCMMHRPHTNCSDMCFHGKYRSIDGTCNNLNHPMWGASLTGFRRVLKPIYENGFSMPIGWKKTMKYYGFHKPSARLVSTRVISTKEVSPDERLTHMVMQWGQFLDHDLDHAIPSVSSESWDGIDCKRSCEYAAPCYPIEVPPNDPRVTNRRCIDFFRSSAICGSGQTSVFFDTVMPREQINQLTSYIDASQVYGFSEEVARDLREFRNNHGLLREGIRLPNHKSLLPLADSQPNDCRRDPLESDIGCFLAGDIRSNEQLGLLAMHTIWFREHNRVATELRHINPHWDGDMLYHEARKIVGAEIQHITYKQWLPLVLGGEGISMLGEYKGYDPTVNPSISNVFATAALRFGHSLINPVLQRLNKTFGTIPEGDIPLQKAFFSPWRIVEEGGVDPLLRGLFAVPAKLKKPHQMLNTELTEHLFEVAHAVALDLAAINIQRGRDHGIPGYNAWRTFCNLSEAHTFEDLRNEISSQSLRDALKELYGHPGNLDIWVGGILEDQLDGAKMGPTFRCLLVEQFRRLRDGDRFWYENPSVFKPEQLTQIKQVSLGRVLCDNGDDISDVTKDVFILPKKQSPAFVPCGDLPQIDLRFWTECCHDCSNSGQFNSLTQLPSLTSGRSRRALDYSYPSDRPVTLTTPTYTNNTLPTQIPDAIDELSTLYTLQSDSNEVDEERIEGIESALEEFQKTIKQLRRKIRKLEHHLQINSKHANGNKCMDSDGNWRKGGDTWKKDNCTQCICKEKQVTCTTERCPHVTCTTPIQQDGECCPACA